MRKTGRWLAGLACVATALALVTGCTGQDGFASRLRAPRRFGVDPVSPRGRDYPEFAAAPVTRADVPELPPLRKPLTAGNLQPMAVANLDAAAEGEAGPDVPLMPSRLDPGGLVPWQQLVHGGESGEADLPGEYEIGLRDRLRVVVEDHPEFSGNLVVGHDGSIQVPNTNDFIEVRGLTAEQAALAVKARVADYIRGAVAVEVKVLFGQNGFYYLFGEVRNQGRFPIGLTPVRLSEAIFRANSRSLNFYYSQSPEERLRDLLDVMPREGYMLPTYARMDQVSIITPHRSHPTRVIYDVKSSLYQGRTGDDPYIRPGQIVFVPSTFDKRIINFFNRFVAPIRAVGRADAEVNHWYGRITGNTVSGVKPVEYKMEDRSTGGQ
jgi:protein involved in polysaccharide export with SLBB domain